MFINSFNLERMIKHCHDTAVACDADFLQNEGDALAQEDAAIQSVWAWEMARFLEAYGSSPLYRFVDHISTFIECNTEEINNSDAAYILRHNFQYFV